MSNPLKGKKAVLLNCEGDPVIRIYTNGGQFKDYNLRHNDLSIIIDDVDHDIYTDKNGEEFIDYSCETLGHKK